MQFSHLHNHTQFSLLDGASSIKKIFKKALEDNMPAVAITDHGNMYGAFDFVAEAYKHVDEHGVPKVKPILGCEVYIAEDRLRTSFTREDKDKRYHQLLLAKNEEGYKNLIKLCSLGFTEGLYGKYPRVDKELIKQYSSGLIATTCCLGALVPQTILKQGPEAGKKELEWWLDVFGEDYYIELQRHQLPEQDEVNHYLIQWAKEYNIPIVATNDSHYMEQDDFETHDTLLCVSTSEKKSTPRDSGMIDEDGSDIKKRFAFPNDQFFFKNTAQMLETFADLPEAIENTNLIVDKVKVYSLKKDISLPKFDCPAPFKTEIEYLRALTHEGAKLKYPIIDVATQERINFELGIIENMGFAGYFLIVSDFIKWAKNNGIYVGPGRGSAAGSVVAYCIDITNVDPIKYKLLFERFLNPERASMPDIDTDFDDEGRQRVIDYVVNRYGSDRVAQIITYGTMAAKSSIKDVARVMELPLERSNALAKLVPEKPGITLSRVFNAPLRGDADSLAEKEQLIEDDLKNIEILRKIYNGKGTLDSKILHDAEKLEGTVRNTGIHAAGIIIAPQELDTLIPVCKSKESELLVTQFEGSIIEEAGVIKMDFLGLKNLSILRDTIQMIKTNHEIEINLDELPLDDEKTFQLYQAGMTNGTFQFESPGMQKYLIDLKPDRFEDLIAMCALYRPGPMAYIDTYIARKHGRSPVAYDLPEMEEYLQETYGITVYQEQVMLLSQKLANFTKGEADVLRKAMGKKQKAVLDKMKNQFITGCEANNHPTKVAEKIWTDWEAFAQYAFNKSHSVCYALVAYQTAYLKANYPNEYMAALLNNQNSIEKIAFYMSDCRKMGLSILGPDINESLKNFAVVGKNTIRFGLGAIKSVGENIVDELIQERNNNGPYKNIFDLVERINPKCMNRRCLEAMAQAGVLDSLNEYSREQFLATDDQGISNSEKILRYGSIYHSSQTQSANTLFGDIGGIEISKPEIVSAEPWNLMERLNREKEMVGMYLTGHPLDPYEFELKHFQIPQIKDVKVPGNKNKMFRIVGFVSNIRIAYTKKGDEYGVFTITDYSDSFEIALFSSDYITHRGKFIEGEKVLVSGIFEENKYSNDGTTRFKLFKVTPLSELRDMATKEVIIHIDVEQIHDHVIDTLKNLLSKSTGKLTLSFKVTGKDIERPFKLKKMTEIAFTDELVEYLKGLPEDGYRLILS